jgi:pimeloyl-ACP methyl ester carboxylesterase
MKRKLKIAACVVIALVAVVFGATKLAVRHERLPLFDMVRNRSVPVDLYVRRDIEMKAMAGMEVLPVAIISHGNTVGSHEYSFLANMLAARGYLVASVQHDLPTDPPLSMKGYPYVGRLPSYERGVANIDFAISELRKIEPIADYDHLTMVGHSQGGDISVFYAAGHPDSVVKVVTLDNLRVPLEFVKAKMISFRSNGASYFKPDTGVVPSEADCEKDGIQVVMTGVPHWELNDRGTDDMKGKISDKLAQFLDDEKPLPKQASIITPQYAPGAPY